MLDPTKTVLSKKYYAFHVWDTKFNRKLKILATRLVIPQTWVLDGCIINFYDEQTGDGDAVIRLVTLRNETITSNTLYTKNHVSGVYHRRFGK